MTQRLASFRLEEYLATREFSAKYMFCASDVESRSIQDILSLVPEHQQQEFMELSLSYTEPAGHPILRSNIAAMYPGLSREHVLCFAGAEEAIYTATRVLLEPRDHAITIVPGYQSLESVAQSICEVTPIPLDQQDGHWRLDVAKIEAAIRPNTKMLLCNFPHNPTGYIPPRETFDAIIELVAKHDILLFSDEVYRGLAINPEYTLPSASEVYPKAISLGVMSKSFGLAGLRIGWVTCQDKDILTKLNNYKHYLSICNSAPSEWLANRCLEHHDKVLAQNNSLIGKNYQAVKQYFFSRPDLFQWFDPQGGCIAYPKYLGNEPILTIADRLLTMKGVVILPDWVYGQQNQHFRVAFGRANCTQALAEFSAYFEGGD